MQTLETVIVLPVILIFVLALICVSLKYTEIVSTNAEQLKEQSLKETVSYSDVVRGGEIVNDLYRKYVK